MVMLFTRMTAIMMNQILVSKCESAFATYEDAPFISVQIVEGNEIKIMYLIENDCCQHIIHQATVTTVNKAIRKINQYMSN